MDKNIITSRIKDICKNYGFFKIGISKAEPLSKESEYLKQWLAESRNADMDWLSHSYEKRINPSLVLPEVKSIISLAYLYNTPFTHSESPDIPKISRYAWGENDYHKVIKKKLKEICRSIELYLAGTEIKTKYFIDDSPVMEKRWAVKSGIGWQGKNTTVINPEYGSFFFIADILINVELEADESIEDLCKTCKLCIKSCPTGALYEEYKLDANLCIAYHTIESKKEIPDNIDLKNWIFGCDICQDVCPYNKKKFFTVDKSFYPKKSIFNKTREELLKITEEEFNTEFTGSTIKRAKYERWRRNLEKINSTPEG
ncbi:MAG: tRNA epoxyqueuosine(34) reductase QueG [Ignavibacteriae bacterium]|nr:tRNA epoxyqueuosine(34) reductase QueG [Ignavibacteriota bacterium]